MVCVGVSCWESGGESVFGGTLVRCYVCRLMFLRRVAYDCCIFVIGTKGRGYPYYVLRLIE